MEKTKAHFNWSNKSSILGKGYLFFIVTSLSVWYSTRLLLHKDEWGSPRRRTRSDVALLLQFFYLLLHFLITHWPSNTVSCKGAWCWVQGLSGTSFLSCAACRAVPPKIRPYTLWPLVSLQISLDERVDGWLTKDGHGR